MTTYAIELNNIYPNQEFDLMFEDIKNSLHILLQTVNQVTLMSISINNTRIGHAFLCLPNTPVIPYPWIVERVGGNFVFETENNNYPNYENFGTTCNLYFVTQDELNNAE